MRGTAQRLPGVVIDFSASDHAVVTIDDAIHDTPDPVSRSTLGRLLDETAARLGPVRVEVREADGRVFTDLVVPNAETAPANASELRSAEPAPVEPDVSTGPFDPDESLYIAVIVTDQRADHDGHARLRLPPALHGRAHGVVALLGRSSGTYVICDEP